MVGQAPLARRAWADAAGYAVADLTMLRRELVLGYGIAGFLTVMVSADTWNSVFLTGHGFWTTLGKRHRRPVHRHDQLRLLRSATSPWPPRSGTAASASVASIAFIFADLITIPLLLIYRKYYGGRLTLRLLLWFWAVMSTVGLLTELLFDAAGLIPTNRTQTIVETGFKWNYTTFLNVIFLALGGYLYWLYRNRERLGGGAGYAIDPVCGMQIQTRERPRPPHPRRRQYWFCSDRCATRFATDPERHSPEHGIGS